MNWVKVTFLIYKDENIWTENGGNSCLNSIWYSELNMTPKIFTTDVHILYNLCLRVGGPDTIK